MGRGGDARSTNAGGIEPTADQQGEDTFVLPPIPSQDDTTKDPQVWDLIVVGAGIAGTTFACEQGRQGRKTLLLERDLRQPDRIVGELLQPGGYLALKRLGLERCVEGIDAQRVKGYCMFKDGAVAKVAYPLEGFGDDVAGRSFHHGRFVQRLRQAAAACNNVTVRQGVVKCLVNDQGEDWEEGQVVTGVRYKSAAGDGKINVAYARLTVVCDGMYSTLRTKLSKPSIRHPSYFVGLLLKDVELPNPNFGHVVLGNPAPILFYPISSTEVRCLVDYPGTCLPGVASGELKNYLMERVSPQIPDSLRPAFDQAVSSGRIRTMQNKQLTAAPLHQPGALLLGDAFNMRHPLTGGGMTVALSDTALLCDMLRPLPDFTDPIATANATAAFYVKRKPLSATINTLANALYKVFCYTGSRAHEEMRLACFDYLKLGGIYSSGPVSLLSGLNPRPSVLVAHFFMVALYGVGRLLIPRPTIRGVLLGVSLIHAACCIIFPIIAAEGVRAVFFPFLTRSPKPGPSLQRAASQLRL
jgi:squalene monooxygenase